MPEGAFRSEEAATLVAGAKALGLALADAQIGRLLAYRDLLLRWNRTYNLTAIRDADDALSHHVLDSLAALPPLLRQSAGLARQVDGHGERALRVLDAGSGGGLPGLVFAVAAPQLEVMCVDSVAKKMAFVQQVVAELGLRNARAIHARIEQEPAAWRGTPVPIITSRAFSSLADLVRLTDRHLAQGGLWMALKGRVPADELAALPAEIDVFHVEPLRVPSLDAQRCIVWMRRKADDAA